MTVCHGNITNTNYELSVTTLFLFNTINNDKALLKLECYRSQFDRIGCILQLNSRFDILKKDVHGPQVIKDL